MLEERGLGPRKQCTQKYGEQVEPRTCKVDTCCKIIMSLREADSARTENLSLYTSLTASRGKDFELGEDNLPESNASETDIPTLSSSFVTFQLPPLHEAAERGDPQSVARLLLDKSVDVNKKVGGHRAMRTALHRAAGYGHLAVVKLLLKVSFVNYPTFFIVKVINDFRDCLHGGRRILAPGRS